MIALAMWGNLIVAATVGVLVPMVLKLVRVDPRWRQGIFVTTFTDVFWLHPLLGAGDLFPPLPAGCESRACQAAAQTNRLI